jgi:hypothetical protein
MACEHLMGKPFISEIFEDVVIQLEASWISSFKCSDFICWDVHI